MTAISQPLHQAHELHRAGRLDEAEQLCRQAISTDARDADALVLLGVLARQRGDVAAAIACWQEATSLRPHDAALYGDLGMLHAHQRRWTEAAACFRAVLRICSAASSAQGESSEVRCDSAMAAHALGNLGNTLKELGQLDEAIDHYREAVRIEPRFAQGYYNLAIACKESGRLDEAARRYREALAICPDFVEARFNLGQLLRRGGEVSEARAQFEAVLRLRPDIVAAHEELGAICFALRDFKSAVFHYRAVLEHRQRPEVYANLGLTLRELREHEEAARCCQRALELNPASAEAHSAWGLVLRDQERLAEALACEQAAVRLRPDSPDIQDALGAVLETQGDHEHALICFGEAARLRPEAAQFQNNLGVALEGLGLADEAASCFRRALHLNPDLAEAHNGLGMICKTRGQVTEAVAAFERALQLNPDYAEAHNNLGVMLRRQAKHELALAHFQRAVALLPTFAQAHVNRAITLLILEDFAAGWPAYEWRRHVPGSPRSSAREWDGSPLAGRSILLRVEQGLGDILQFVRYAPLVAERGGRVLLQCPKRLIPILKTCAGIEQLCPLGESLPPFDVEAPLLSLPGILGTDLNSIPAKVPYLAASGILRDRWRERLSGQSGVRVGIAWQGAPAYREDAFRSIPLAEFAPLAAVAGVRLFSLQRGAGVEQLASAGFWVQDLASQFDEREAAFCETAAVISQLDLVIACDTAIAHLAGALGATVWVPLSFMPDWRWLVDRSDSPWYPTMRLFRQPQLGNWAPVFQQIAAELAALAPSVERDRLRNATGDRTG